MSDAQLCCPNHLLSRSFGYEMGEPIGNKTLEGESVRGGTRGLHQDSYKVSPSTKAQSWKWLEKVPSSPVI